MYKEWPLAAVLAIFAVISGALVRRAKELNDMPAITWQAIFKMIFIDFMMVPAFASLSAVAVIMNGWDILWILPIGFVAGFGGFATGALLWEIGKGLLLNVAKRLDSAKEDQHAK